MVPWLQINRALGDSDSQPVAVATWQEGQGDQRREKGTETLGPAIDLFGECPNDRGRALTLKVGTRQSCISSRVQGIYPAY